MAKLRYTITILMLTTILFCTNEQSQVKNTENDRTICSESGGKYDEEADSCTCPFGLSQKGQRCQPQTALPEVDCETTGGSWAVDVCECSIDKVLRGTKCEEKSKEEVRRCIALGGLWDIDLKSCNCGEGKIWREMQCIVGSTFDREPVQKSCQKAGGNWLVGDSYCHCKNQLVLSGTRCRLLGGEVTKSLCRTATYPGIWKNRQCSCKKGQVFNPAQGGCVPSHALSKSTEALSCGDSLNLGRWQGDSGKCSCPKGRIWHNYNCAIKSNLNSKAICESSGLSGSWNSRAKACHCPLGNLWIDQDCVPARDMNPQRACLADINGGQWDDNRQVCLCPGIKTWVKEINSCLAGAKTPLAKLCVASGGRYRKSACSCPGGLAKANSDSLGFCARDKEAKAPGWLLMALGLRR